MNGVRLGDAIAPWLVSDAALHFRVWYRGDEANTPRALEGGAMLLNLLLAWGFGLFVLGALWWTSMPARSFWMTGLAGLSLFVSLIAGGASLAAMVLRLRNKKQQPYRSLFATAPAMGAMIALIPLFAALSYERTTGSAPRLAPLDLSGENIVERPAGWLSYQDAKAEFRADWCDREGIKEKDCKDLGDRQSAFDAEFERRRLAALNDMRCPDWGLRTSEPTNMDFRNATLTNAFLAGANLRGAQMEGATLVRAQMEGADLFRAQMEGAVFDFSELTGAPDAVDVLLSTNLSRSINNGGLLRFVDLSDVTFDSQTDFRNAFLDGSVEMTDAFRTQMGEGNPDGPCQWASNPIADDTEFYGRWRGWVEAKPNAGFSQSWQFVGPPEWRDVEAIPPPPGCTWKTGPMPETE